MVVELEVSLLLIPMTQYCCTNSYPEIFYLIRVLLVGLNLESENLPDKLVNLWIFTIGLTSSGCRPHTSSIWPWSGAPKVHLYNTFLGGLRQALIHCNSRVVPGDASPNYQQQLCGWLPSLSLLQKWGVDWGYGTSCHWRILPNF